MSAQPQRGVNDVFDEDPPAAGGAPQINVDNLDEDANQPAASPPGSNRGPNSARDNQALNSSRQNQEAPKVEDQKVSKTSTYFNTKTMVSVQRSNLLTNNDRHQQEIGILRNNEVGAGLLGLRKIDLKDRKMNICGIDDKKALPQNDELIKFLQTDGIFIDPSLMFKNKDINVQKLEERLLNSGQREYFKHNGEIKINNSLLADELTRPADLAFEQTDAFQTIEQSAIVTDRMNSFKKRYYRIDIIVGKLILKKYKELFSTEDQMMIDLKQMCKVYDRRVSLALIPFYMERIDFLADEISQKEVDGASKKDIQFLQRMRDNIKTDLDNEKKEIAKSAQKIYDLWQAIETERKDQPSTFYDLKVHQGNDGQDVLFNLKKRQVQGNPAGIAEKIKKQAESTQVYSKLIIDGMDVAQTRKMPINWPSFEVDILDQFQIFVFTLPNKVQLEIYFNDRMTDRIDLVIPGSQVKSLTSASRLIKEYEFSKRELYIDEQLARGVDLRKDQEEMDANEKKNLKSEVEKMEKTDIDGSIFVKAEWDGYGDQMPPARSESIFNNSNNQKNRNYFTKQEQHTIFQEQRPLDVNDPRNEDIIKSIQMMKNDYLDKLLTNDSKYQLHDLESFRHKLLRARQNDPEYAGIPIPQVNSELINGEISKYYVDWLEQVHREETFKAYLAKKQEQEEMQDLGASDRNTLSAGMFDAATLSRRQKIFDDINKRRKISQQGISSNQQVPYNSIISEPQFERGENILELIGNLFTFQRKLKPKVKKRQVQSYESLPECKMLFHIIRATDVPIRLSYYENYDKYQYYEKNKGQKKDKGGFQTYDDIFQEKQVETFIEIKLVNTETHEEVILKTQAAEGQYPEWNEILAYTLRAKDKMSFKKTELEQSPILIYFTLFDQLIQSEQITKMRTMTYRENRYLGYFCVPLTTILKGSKFEGQVKIERPLVIQGYRVMEDDIVFMQKKGLEDHEKRNEEQIPTYLNLTITLEPLITLPRENERDYYQGFEKGPFLQVGSEWVKQLENKFFKQQRQYKVFLENIQGQSVFIPKFLTPLKPHASLYDGPNDKKGIEKAARYVSLIPYLEDSTLFKDMPDLTCTSQQFLDLGMGDSEEHSMLLCNYFNFIDRDQGRQKMNPKDPAKKFDINSYIIFGEAIPNGECWFVARIDMKEIKSKDPSVELWNPMNGECYSFGANNDDPVCPLKKVWLIVGQENVWANVQPDEIPSLIVWDIENPKLWAPFLDKERKEAHYKGGVQSEQINVGAPDLIYSDPVSKEEQIFILENQIKKYLAGKFEDERIAQVKKTTNWNITDGDTIKKMLQGDKDNELANIEMGVKDKLQNRHGGYNPAEATYKRYYVDKKLDNVLIDFEDYSLLARKGGTDSKLRSPEESKVNKDEDIRQMIVQEYLNQVGMEHEKKVFAVPINCTLTSLEALWGVLKNVRMHEIDSQDVEFSLSVMLRPYPCNVFSVWMYIAVFRDDLEDD